MGFRDRFFTPRTAKAILSWRLLIGLGVAAAMVAAGSPIGVAVAVGFALYAGSVLAAMPKRAGTTTIDPFTLSEPWRQFVQAAQRSRRQLAETVRTVPAGPLRDRLQDIADRLAHGIEQSWAIARRGDQIDDHVRRLDPTRLRSRLATLEQRAATAPTDNAGAAVASVRDQLATADRLKALSASTADRLRLSQARFDELVARAAEVAAGASDTADYEHDVDELVIELEAMQLAVRELPGEPGTPTASAT
ncbi:MAG: hypothetical protein ACK5OX_04775 [Desertimonas sp.]